jgi:hypothetical protein
MTVVANKAFHRRHPLCGPSPAVATSAPSRAATRLMLGSQTIRVSDVDVGTQWCPNRELATGSANLTRGTVSRSRKCAL